MRDLSTSLHKLADLLSGSQTVTPAVQRLADNILHVEVDGRRTTPLQAEYTRLAKPPRTNDPLCHTLHAGLLALGKIMTRPAELTPGHVEDLRRLADALSPPTNARPRRRRTRTAPLTDKQALALELYAKHNGRIVDVAAELGVSRSVVRRQLQAAWKKLPGLAPKTARRGKKQRLPTDSRGQVSVSPVSGKRRPHGRARSL